MFIERKYFVTIAGESAKARKKCFMAIESGGDLKTTDRRESECEAPLPFSRAIRKHRQKYAESSRDQGTVEENKFENAGKKVDSSRSLLQIEIWTELVTGNARSSSSESDDSDRRILDAMKSTRPGITNLRKEIDMRICGIARELINCSSSDNSVG
jgi:hypothetical protein